MTDTNFQTAVEKMCYFDDIREIIVHCFDPGKCRCLCGEKVIRKPAKKSTRIGEFGRGVKLTTDNN